MELKKTLPGGTHVLLPMSRRPVEPTERDRLVTSVAKMMCAAYWRGRLEDSFGVNELSKEAAIKAVAELEVNWTDWITAARMAVGDAILEKNP